MFGSGSNRGEINVSLPDVKERKRSTFEIESRLRKRFIKIPGTKVTMESGGMMFGGGGDIQIKIFGYDRKITTALGDNLEVRMKSVQGVVDVTKSYSQPKPEYQIRIDRDRVSALGLSVFQIATTIETAVIKNGFRKYIYYIDDRGSDSAEKCRDDCSRRSRCAD